MSERDEFDSFQYFLEFTVTVSSSNLNNYFFQNTNNIYTIPLKNFTKKDWDTERFQIGLMNEISKLPEEVIFKEIMFFQFYRKEESGKKG